jgi:hypothetical protein
VNEILLGDVGNWHEPADPGCPVCTENSILIDYATESPNVSGDDCTALLCFFLTLFASPFKSSSRLEAENAALRHQLIVLPRRVRGRVHLTNGDRLFLVQLYRWFPSVLKAITIIRPETLVRGIGPASVGAGVCSAFESTRIEEISHAWQGKQDAAVTVRSLRLYGSPDGRARSSKKTQYSSRGPQQNALVLPENHIRA